MMDSFWAKVQVSPYCWHYGDYKYTNHTAVLLEGKYVGVHKVAYEYLIGPVPEGMELDHLCHNKRCVNPDHLEPVTHAENLRRAWALKKLRGGMKREASERKGTQTHCWKGHELAKVGVLLSAKKDGKVRRRCRACQQEIQTRWRRKNGIADKGNYKTFE